MNITRIFCRHKTKHIKVLGGSVNVEILADRCVRCGKLFNKRTEY
ncbi:hypothetical protein [Aequorivita echinoideorum]|nr:hypothetical protein [Aequorivita echinoideorum]